MVSRISEKNILRRLDGKTVPIRSIGIFMTFKLKIIIRHIENSIYLNWLKNLIINVHVFQ